MISNGFDTAKVLEALKGRLAWRQPVYSGPTLSVSRQRQDKYYIVGSGMTGAPSEGDKTLSDPDLKGYSYDVEIRGLGTVLNDVEITINPNGGFSLVDSSAQFWNDEVIIIHFKATTSIVPSGEGTGPVLDTDNTTSKSGRYFQDFHSVVTIQNVYSTMDVVAASDENFNNYLQDLQQSVIIEALNAVFIKPQLVESKLLFERCAYSPRLIDNAGNFVGFEIRIGPGSYSLQVNTVMLEFDQDVTFNLYLYNETRKAPLWSKEVTAVGNDETIIPLDDLIFKHSSPDNKGGLFYLGYFQDDLGAVRAIEQNEIILNPGLIYDAVSFESKATVDQFDKEQVYNNYRNYGLNLELSVFRDYTKTIVQNAYLFDELVGLHMAARVIEGVIFSERSNKTQRISAENSQQLYTDLNQSIPTQEVPFNSGIKTKISRELKKVYRNFFPKDKILTVTPCL